MKNLITVLLTLLLFGCSKEESKHALNKTTNPQFISTLKEINKKFISTQETGSNTRVIGTFYGFMTDVFTGCGAAAMTSLSGPGAVAFGVAVGVYFSSECRANGNFSTDDDCYGQNIQHVFGGTPNYSDMNSQDYWSIYTNNEYEFEGSNPYDECGIFHNLILKQGECTSIFSGGYAAAYDSIVNLVNVLDQSLPNLGLDDTLLLAHRTLLLQVAYDYQKLNINDQSYREDLETLFFEAGLFEENNISDALIIYIDGVEQLGMANYSDFSDYHSEFEGAVESSTELNPSEKNAILSVLAISKFSYLYWSNATEN